MSVKKLMDYALKQVGTEEKPSGSNAVKYNTWYYGRRVSGSSYPWCCAFVCYCFNKTGMGNIFYGGRKTASTRTLESWAKQKKLTVGKNDGRYGDVVLFNFGGSRTCHVGLIIKKNADGSYQTIEGNTSVTSNDNGGKVMIRTRYKSQISAIYRPQYDLPKLIKVTGTTKKFKDCNVKSKVLAKFTSNDKVRWIKDMKNGWSMIMDLSDGEIGYIKNKYLGKKGLSDYPVKKIIKAAAFRKSNKATAKKLQKTLIPVGTEVKEVYRGKSWSNVIINGKSGYVATNKISKK